MEIKAVYKFLEYGYVVTDTLDPSGVEITVTLPDGSTEKTTLAKLVKKVYDGR
jgi:hypothetical protein